MAWDLANVTVQAIPGTDDVRITVNGAEGFVRHRDEVRQISAGNGKSIDALLAFIGITAARAGADISTPAKAKAYIEGRQWPW